MVREAAGAEHARAQVAQGDADVENRVAATHQHIDEPPRLGKPAQVGQQRLAWTKRQARDEQAAAGARGLPVAAATLPDSGVPAVPMRVEHACDVDLREGLEGMEVCELHGLRLPCVARCPGPWWMALVTSARAWLWCPDIAARATIGH